MATFSEKKEKRKKIQKKKKKEKLSGRKRGIEKRTVGQRHRKRERRESLQVDGILFTKMITRTAHKENSSGAGSSESSRRYRNSTGQPSSK